MLRPFVDLFSSCEERTLLPFHIERVPRSDAPLTPSVPLCVQTRGGRVVCALEEFGRNHWPQQLPLRTGDKSSFPLLPSVSANSPHHREANPR